MSVRRYGTSKDKKLDVSQQWLARYHDPRAPSSLGGVQRFARAHQIPLKKAQRVLERDLAYMLHKPRRRRFPTVPVIVGGLDDQWVADLVEVQPLAKYNRGIRYLLTVLDVLSKYAWVQPLKTKTGMALVQAFGKILKQGRRPNRTHFEPRHIHYVPVRNEPVEIVETQMAETNGDLVQFGEGHTLLTLHFKREVVV